jgi:glycosyltransferase involved in cell wall biosynthesis
MEIVKLLVCKELLRAAHLVGTCYDAARVRILLDYRPALRQRTGVGQYVHELAQALVPALNEEDSLVLFSSSWKDRVSADAVPGATVVDARIPVSALNLAWHRLEWPPVDWLSGPVDVAHSAHPLLMPARRALRVVTIHDLDFLDHPERTDAEIRRDYPALTASHASRADLVVVVSEHTARQVESRLGIPRGRMALCRPGAPPPVFNPFVQAAGPILFIGTIEPRKNLPMLSRAYEQVARRRHDIPPLLIVGKQGDQSAGILAQLRTDAPAGRIEYRGYLPDLELQRLYAEASMLVLASLEEGFGMTLVEAMQAGVPVIASARGALPEVVGEAGILVDPTSAADIAAAIERLLDRPDERRQRIAAGRVQAARFSWSNSAKALMAAYRAASAGRRAGA